MRKVLCSVALLATGFFVLSLECGDANSSWVWEPENEWTLEWEIKYAKWVENAYHYYRKGGGAERYFPMSTNSMGETGVFLDCTNLLYATRAIFAYENKLPFMTRLSGFDAKTNSYFDWSDLGHFSTQFARYPRGDARFKAFLRHLLSTAYSCTVNDDTFPIGVSPEILMPGQVFVLNPAMSHGHNYLLFRIEKGPDIKNPARKPIMVLGGTVPANIPLPEFYFFKQQGRLRYEGCPWYRRGGFRAWLVPRRNEKGSWELVIPEYGKAWYSEEQYTKEFLLLQQIIDERFQTPVLPPEEEFRAGIVAVSYSLYKRVLVIADGDRGWVARGRPAILDENTLFELGTTNTDRRITFAVREIFSVNLSDAQKDAILDEYAFDITGHGTFVSMKTIMRAFLNQTISSSPVDPLEKRWGITEKEEILGENSGGRKILPDMEFPPLNDDYSRIINYKALKGTNGDASLSYSVNEDENSML